LDVHRRARAAESHATAQRRPCRRRCGRSAPRCSVSSASAALDLHLWKLRAWRLRYVPRKRRLPAAASRMRSRAHRSLRFSDMCTLHTHRRRRTRRVRHAHAGAAHTARPLSALRCPSCAAGSGAAPGPRRVAALPRGGCTLCYEWAPTVSFLLRGGVVGDGVALFPTLGCG